MKSLLSVILALLIVSGAAMAGDKSSPKGLKWLSFEEAKVAAAKQKKTILLDVYTDWCKWCKKMDADTYGNPKVMEYLGKKFIIAKLNPEEDGNVIFKGKSITKAEFAQNAGVNGYPTLLFFDAKGELITGISSYLEAKQFLNIAQFIGDGKYEKMSWDEYSKTLKD